LENRGGENDKVSRGMWKTVETGTGKVRMGEAKGRREKRRSWKEEGRKGKEDKEKGEDNGSEESSREMGNMGGGGGSSKVRSRGQEVGTRKVP